MNIVSSKFASKVRTGNNGIELSSIDEHSREGREKAIRVEKSWVTESTTNLSAERGPMDGVSGQGATRSTVHHTSNDSL